MNEVRPKVTAVDSEVGREGLKPRPHEWRLPTAAEPAEEGGFYELAKRKAAEAAKAKDAYSSIQLLAEALQAVIAYLESPGPK